MSVAPAPSSSSSSRGPVADAENQREANIASLQRDQNRRRAAQSTVTSASSAVAPTTTTADATAFVSSSPSSSSSSTVDPAASPHSNSSLAAVSSTFASLMSCANCGTAHAAIVACPTHSLSLTKVAWQQNCMHACVACDSVMGVLLIACRIGRLRVYVCVCV